MFGCDKCKNTEKAAKELISQIKTQGQKQLATTSSKLARMEQDYLLQQANLTEEIAAQRKESVENKKHLDKGILTLSNMFDALSVEIKSLQSSVSTMRQQQKELLQQHARRLAALQGTANESDENDYG